VTKKQSSPPDFESALTELEKIVERMEKGDQNLEDALKEFERGIELTRVCQKSLKEAEQRVEKLVQKEGELTTEPYTPEE
jgi:exodeoxyribonuclease VII small subunit